MTIDGFPVRVEAIARAGTALTGVTPADSEAVVPGRRDRLHTIGA
jgi:hypothetical protein